MAELFESIEEKPLAAASMAQGHRAKRKDGTPLVREVHLSLEFTGELPQHIAGAEPEVAQVRFGDYHSILECEPQASPYAVREQRDRLARKFSPRGWPHRLNPEEIDILNEISRGIADAFLILSDPELAMRYERALAGSTAPMLPPDALPR